MSTKVTNTHIFDLRLHSTAVLEFVWNKACIRLCVIILLNNRLYFCSWIQCRRSPQVKALMVTTKNKWIHWKNMLKTSKSFGEINELKVHGEKPFLGLRQGQSRGARTPAKVLNPALNSAYDWIEIVSPWPYLPNEEK